MDYSIKTRQELIEEISILSKELRKQRRYSKKIKNETTDKLQKGIESCRKLVESSRDAMIIHINQEIVFANPSALELIGLKDINHLRAPLKIKPL